MLWTDKMNFFRKIFGLGKDNKKWYHKYCILQKDISENSLVCTSILLNYFGNKTKIRNLKRQFPDYKSKNGFAGIEDFCARNGIRTSKFSCSANELRDKKLPCLIYWGLERFVVLIAIENEEFCVLDPGKSRTEYNFSDFECFYCEEGLAVNP